MGSLFKLMRPHHWVKNLFVFIPAFFAEVFLDPGVLGLCFLTFFAFSFGASGVYILNDIMDRELDALHPEKKDRPIASGAVTRGNGGILLIACWLIGGVLAFLVSVDVLLILGAYIFMNILYSIKLKHIALLDITLVSFGFILREYAGAAAADVPVSKWLILMTFLLAMLLALAKRRDEVIRLKEGEKVRKAIDGYNIVFVDASMVMMSAVTVVTYIMYTVSEEVVERTQSDQLYLTSIFVVLGLLRYLQQALVKNAASSPTRLLYTDHFIQFVLLSWILSFYFILYV